MAGYDIPREICPLEKRISDFSVSCGYDPMTVFNDFLMFVIHGFSPVNPEKPDVPLNKNDAFQKVQKRRVQEKR